jgi:hypothetical protein
MAEQAKREGEEAPSRITDDSSVVDCIRAIAAYNARAAINSEHQMTLFLKSWWSNTYKRPLKDPLLESYTLEELLYEFYDKMERQQAAEERVASEADKIEETKEKEVLDWAEAEEKRELEEMQLKAAKQATDPVKDPANQKWMEEEIRKAKEQFGPEFGEDISADFE